MKLECACRNQHRVYASIHNKCVLCSFRSTMTSRCVKCKQEGAIPCFSVGCNKFICSACFNKLLEQTNLEPLNDGVVAHCKTCHGKVAKAQLASSKLFWTNDAYDSETYSSMQILLNWMTTEGNYSLFRGDVSSPSTLSKRKKDYCADLAKFMNDSKVQITRTGKMVRDKIHHLEASFRKAHDWANNTGQGVEKDGEEFKAAVELRCEYYYLLEPIMGDRASAQPKHTTDSFLGGDEVPDDGDEVPDDLDDVEDDDEDSEGGDTNNINKRNNEDSDDDDDDDEATEEEKEEVYSRVSKGSSLTTPPIDDSPVVHETPVRLVNQTPVRKRPVIVSKKRPPVAVATAARSNQFDEYMKSNIIERQEVLKLKKDAFAFKKQKLKVMEEQGKWQGKSHEHSYRMTLWKDFKDLMSQEFVPTDHQLLVINPDFKQFLETYEDIPDDEDTPDDKD